MNRATNTLFLGLFHLVAGTVFAAKDTRWISADNPSWHVPGNWSNGAPTNTAPSNNKLDFDTVYFRDSAEDVVSTILLEEDVFIGKISFTTIGNKPPANYIVGAPDGPTIHLTFTGGSFENHCNAGAYPNVTQTIAAPLKIYSNTQFYSDSSDPTSTFVLGDISSGASTRAEIQLKGDNTGNNRINGVISDGEFALSVTKINGGWWTLSGQSTYSGVTAVSVGTLIAGDDIPPSGPSPFGSNNASNAIRLGYPNPTSASWARPCRILAGTKPDGTPVTINRRIDVQTNNRVSEWPQDTCIGGANTHGTSHIQGTISNYRTLFLVCATGGTCAFDGPPNHINMRDRPTIIGYPGFEGTVALVSKFNNNNALLVSNGVLRADGPITAASVCVGPHATLSGAGTLTSTTSPILLEADAILTGDALTLQSDVTLEPGAILQLPTTATPTPALSIQGTLTLEGAKLQLAPTADAYPAHRIHVVHAANGILGTPDLSEIPSSCTVLLSPTDIELSFQQSTLILLQ